MEEFHSMGLWFSDNARSVTGRIFTVEEHGQNHCQVGNRGLALREMVQWMSSL